MSLNISNFENVPQQYSGKFTGSFAYLTIKDRLPIILVKVVDHLCQNKAKLVELFGENATNDVKEIIGRLSELQNEMVTGKLIKTLEDEDTDAVAWNEYLKQQEALYNFSPAWFESSWLYAECYFYRRIKQAFELSTSMKSFDPFQKQKEDSFLSTLDVAVFLLSSLEKDLCHLCNSNGKVDLWLHFQKYIEISLWGNKCDLSMSAGKENIQQTDPIANSEQLRKNILVNQTETAFKLFKNRPGAKIHFVLDNAGFELLCDLILMEFLSQTGLARSIHIHVKEMPWFVSDTMLHDIEWLLKTLTNSGKRVMMEFSNQCSKRLENRDWVIDLHSFWTMPHDFSEMESADPYLYRKLSVGDLLLFKGDLNYRKLTADRMWSEDTEFSVALNGFLPTSVLSLRTIKADVVVGLEPGTCEKLEKEHSDNWRFGGDFALIQCATI